MPAYKDKVTGTWYVKFYSKDWTGERKQIKRRGFETKKDALDFERNFKVREEYNLDMTFDEFFKLYSEDMQNRLKRNKELYVVIGYDDVCGNGNYEAILYGVYSTQQLAREAAEELLELGNIHHYEIECPKLDEFGWR